MNDTNAAIEMLKRIQQPWAELGRATLNSPEYPDIMKQIRALSADYQSLVDAPQKGEKSRLLTTNWLITVYFHSVLFGAVLRLR